MLEGDYHICGGCYEVLLIHTVPRQFQGNNCFVMLDGDDIGSSVRVKYLVKR